MCALSTDLRGEGARRRRRKGCETYQGAVDLRAKLFALLPMASRVGIVLISRDDPPKPAAADLAAIGLFGLAVTFGLFMHGLRGRQPTRAARGATNCSI